ncbi:MAG: hypothetical protein JWL70_2337 [Acidimicrobiia bacterium]|nr:hypothetical protein [Acidimicrobiia bacterium]
MVTNLDGSSVVADTAAMEVELSYRGGAVVQSVSTSPAVEGLEALVGRIATTGFRAVIDSDTSAQRGALVYLLLDEIPVSTLVSGYSVLHATSRGELEDTVLGNLRPPGPPIHGPDMCAGFQVGGTIAISLEAGRHAVVTGPDATDILDAADPNGWHEMPGTLRADAMRRWRRHDLWRDHDGLLNIDTFFRDSHMAPDGTETIIHEYTVAATVDPVAMRVVSCEATPRVLPFVECPQAAASASRLAGMAVFGLRPQARAELLGPTTCTHLTDTLREIEDVVALAELLPR